LNESKNLCRETSYSLGIESKGCC